MGFGMPWTLNICHSSHFNAFFPVKINKMWNFCLNFWFFRNHLLQRLETCTIRFGMPWTLNTCHSSHFDAFFPVKINKMLNFLAVYWTPLDKKWKIVNLYSKKVFKKAWKSAHIGFWICRSQCTRLELCVTSTFWVMRVSLNFWQKGLGIGLWNMVHG